MFVRSFVRSSVRSLPAFLEIGSLVFGGARFSKKIYFRPEMLEINRKNRFFGIFSRFHHQFFSDFLHKDAYQQCPKHGRFQFLIKKFFFRPKMPDICRKSPFLQIFIGFLPYISLFFQIKTSLITMPTIKNDSIVNKTDF